MKQTLCAALFVVLLLGVVSAENQEVIVLVDDAPTGLARLFEADALSELKNELDIVYEFESVRALAVNVSERELELLKQKKGIKKIELNHKVSLFLQDSINLTGAKQFWEKDNSSFTGVNQSVCIIDTGIDFEHDVFGGEWGEVVVVGKRFLGSDIVDCLENNSACMDDHGHGTHVAGIVKAMSPNVSLVVVKVLDENGDGFSSDVKKGIDYCLSVADDYNITVISLSLGAPCFYEGLPTGLCYSDFCDIQQSSYAGVIDEANNKNISVVVATGNSGLTDFISTPACVENSIRVASSTKWDTLSPFSNVWSHDLFLAPGQMINSTDLNNEYRFRSGTSMATPHVSGALVLLKDYYNETKTNEFLVNVLTLEAVDVYVESLDRNFSRLNLLFNGFIPEEPEEPEDPEEPDPEDPVVKEPEEAEPEPEPSPPPRRGGGGGGSIAPEVTIFEERVADIDPHNIMFAEIGSSLSELETGDVIVMGDDSVFSKYLIPKKWKHVVFYIGPEFKLRNNFGVNSEIYDSLKEYYVEGNEVLVIDSSSIGVSVRDIREFGYHQITAFRPIYESGEAKELAVVYAVDQIGKPYDKLFSARDEAFYCSELVFKSLNEAGFNLKSSDFVWFNKVILPTDLVEQFYERDDFEFLFYFAKEDRELLVKSESDLFDGYKYPVLNAFKSLFLERGVLSYVLWLLVLLIVYNYFFKPKKKTKVNKRRRRR